MSRQWCWRLQLTFAMHTCLQEHQYRQQLLPPNDTPRALHTSTALTHILAGSLEPPHQVCLLHRLLVPPLLQVREHHAAATASAAAASEGKAGEVWYISAADSDSALALAAAAAAAAARVAARVAAAGVRMLLLTPSKRTCIALNAS